MDAEIFVPFVFFGFLAAIILVPIMAKERTRRSAHDLIGRAMDRGQALDPALVAKLSEEMLREGDRARRSLGNAVVLLALAGGFVAAGYVMNGLDSDGDARIAMLIPAVILATVGAAYFLLAIIDYATKKRSA
jgi:hypothetical protein